MKLGPPIRRMAPSTVRARLPSPLCVRVASATATAGLSRAPFTSSRYPRRAKVSAAETTETELARRTPVEIVTKGPVSVSVKEHKEAEPTLQSASTSLSQGIHDSLNTFLDHATRTGLSHDTTVYKGTHYEYTAAASLLRLGFSFRRVGGTGDKGIDLDGRWSLDFPTPAQPITTWNSEDPDKVSHREGEGLPRARVIAQCKAMTNAKVGPNVVRELEGVVQDYAMRRTSTQLAREPVVGMLITTQPASLGVRQALGKSKVPLIFVCCTAGEKASGGARIAQFVWNKATQESLHLERLGVALMYPSTSPVTTAATPTTSLKDGENSPSSSAPASTSSQPQNPDIPATGHVVLTYDGKPISPYLQSSKRVPTWLISAIMEQKSPLVERVQELYDAKKSFIHAMSNYITQLSADWSGRGIDKALADTMLKIRQHQSRIDVHMKSVVDMTVKREEILAGKCPDIEPEASDLIPEDHFESNIKEGESSTTTADLAPFKKSRRKSNTTSTAAPLLSSRFRPPSSIGRDGAPAAFSSSMQQLKRGRGRPRKDSYAPDKGVAGSEEDPDFWPAEPIQKRRRKQQLMKNNQIKSKEEQELDDWLSKNTA